MNDKLYRIKPLEWSEDGLTAETEIMEYYIIPRESNFELRFDYDRYVRIGYFSTIRKCQKAAERHWLNFVKGALEEVK